MGQQKEKETKGLISSIIGTVGGYFYGSKKEDSTEKISEVEPEHVPREFQMKPTSDSEVTSTDLTVKQPIDFKDESEIIPEECEDQTKVVEEVMIEKKVVGKVEATLDTPTREEPLQNDTPTKEEPHQNDTPTKEEPHLIHNCLHRAVCHLSTGLHISGHLA